MNPPYACHHACAVGMAVQCGSRVFLVEMAIPYGKEKFALIEWLGENRFSVLPLCNAKDQTRCKCCSSADFKWINPKGKKPAKYYKALILMISGWYF